jgi:hypothetical protein
MFDVHDKKKIQLKSCVHHLPNLWRALSSSLVKESKDITIFIPGGNMSLSIERWYTIMSMLEPIY